MPFKRQTLTELREQNRAFMQSELQEVGALLRFSNLRVIADVDAGMAHLHYGYLDYIAQQSNPFTATDEWLSAWAALKKIYRKPATAAQCPQYRIKGESNRILPAGSILNRADGYQYATDTDIITGEDGTAIVSITAILPDVTEDVTGGGALSNAAAGTHLNLDNNVAGLDTAGTMVSAATGGADIEEVEQFRARMLLAYQSPPQGGSDTDYEGWALAVAGVTRAWVKRRILGAGSVGIYIMCDGTDTSNNGFPVGTDGLSSLEEWGAVKATGDQLRVADHIYPLQTDTAVVYVCSPIKKIVNFNIKGISNVSSATASQIENAIKNLFFNEGTPTGGGKIYLSDINKVIGNIDDTRGYLLVTPSSDIELAVGELPVLGTVDFS